MKIPDVSTGTRIVRMIRAKPIPCFLSVSGIRVKVWFKSQPVARDICHKEGHHAGSCPDKGKCLRCHESGHFARNCRKPWGRFSGLHAAATAGDHPHSGNSALNVYFAEDLDRGFEAPTNDDRVLADAASVAKAVIRYDKASSVTSEILVVDEGDAVASGATASEVVVVDEGDSPHILMDERYNQLDELVSQASQSILADCGPSRVPSIASSQISKDNVANVSNVGKRGVN